MVADEYRVQQTDEVEAHKKLRKTGINYVSVRKLELIYVDVSNIQNKEEYTSSVWNTYKIIINYKHKLRKMLS